MGYRPTRKALWWQMSVVERDEYTACNVCGSIRRTPADKELRESHSGFWCRKHWVGSPECSTDGCREPVMRPKDGGDGKHCRCCLMPDDLDEDSREQVFARESMLARSMVEDSLDSGQHQKTD